MYRKFKIKNKMQRLYTIKQELQKHVLRRKIILLRVKIILKITCKKPHSLIDYTNKMNKKC